MQDDYIESRLNPQIDYYDKKSAHCHKEHNGSDSSTSS
nr:MAG TPA: SMODS and SLOG-associating 2TM effector domain 1 [Caudoviricetes sp.]